MPHEADQVSSNNSRHSSQALSWRTSAERWTRFGSTPRSFCRASRRLFSVVLQSMHASVTDMPYFSSDASLVSF